MYSVFENLDQISPAAKLANRLKDNVVNASTQYVNNLAKSLNLATKCETLVNILALSYSDICYALRKLGKKLLCL